MRTLDVGTKIAAASYDGMDMIDAGATLVWELERSIYGLIANLADPAVALKYLFSRPSLRGLLGQEITTLIRVQLVGVGSTRMYLLERM